jgi:hypothetical protein
LKSFFYDFQLVNEADDADSLALGQLKISPREDFE